MAKNSINDIAAIVARKQKMGKKEAADVVAAFFNTIADGLRDDRQVKVRGLGTFKVTAVKARESVNVNTGERVVIEGHDKVTFVPDQSMKDLVNKPFADFTTVVVNDGVNFDSVDAAAAAEERKVSAMEQKEEEETDEETEDLRTDEQTDGLKTDEQARQTDGLKTDEQTGQTDGLKTDEQTGQAEEDLKTDEQTGQTEEDLKTDEQAGQTEETGEEVFKSVTESQPVMPEPKKYEAESDEDDEDNDSDEDEDKGTGNDEYKGSDEEEGNDDEVKVSREYFDEQMASCRRRCNRNLVLSLVLLIVGLAGGFFIGRYAVLPDFASNKEVKDTPVVAKVEKPAEKPVAATEPKDTVQPADTPKVEPQVEEKAEEPAPKASEAEEDDIDPDFKKLNADRRLRFGAYEIVGVDKVVKLKKGQTMQSYSNKTLGKDMVVYFQVLNGVNEAKEGDKLKVPKIRLKKQYRK